MTELKRITGHWPDGKTATATQRNTHAADGEWMDDRFGQAFDLSPVVIGPDVPAEQVRAETSGGFWDGVERVEYV